jgi:hypothetical protein
MTTEKKKTPWEIQKKGTPSIDKSNPTHIQDTLLMIITNLDEYKSYVTGDFIYSLLLYGSVSKIEIVEKIKLVPQMIPTIVEKTLSYIHTESRFDDWDHDGFCFEVIEIFHICCLLDLPQTKKYFDSLSKMKYKIIRVYHDLLESYIVKEELEMYKKKYKLLETHLKYMPEGEGYLEAKNHFENCKTEIICHTK